MNEYAVGTMLFAIPLVAILAGVAVTWIKAKHGLIETSAQLTKKLEAELATRDARIAEQAERIKVLERIVTDQPTQLDRDIDRLRA
ncbi:MAG TPA: hypothetical protein VFX89_02205 [Gammaproteobacteria bacterium]|nr:hypothetical protein [Gammaproteobacteria bacterium]